MICECCNKEIATVSLRWITSGVQQKADYCDSCAKILWEEFSWFNGTDTYQWVSIHPIIANKHQLEDQK